jgi:hypothetical protein
MLHGHGAAEGARHDGGGSCRINDNRCGQDLRRWVGDDRRPEPCPRCQRRPDHAPEQPQRRRRQNRQPQSMGGGGIRRSHVSRGQPRSRPRQSSPRGRSSRAPPARARQAARQLAHLVRMDQPVVDHAGEQLLGGSAEEALDQPADGAGCPPATRRRWGNRRTCGPERCAARNPSPRGGAAACAPWRWSAVCRAQPAHRSPLPSRASRRSSSPRVRGG